MAQETPSEPVFISTREAAELLGVSVRTVQLWVESGVLHAWKTAGGHRRIARSSVDAFLAEQQAVIETVSGLQVLKVVLIDDNAAQRELYKLKMESLKLPLMLATARDAFEGLLAVGRSDPDLVIASLDMEGTDGSALVRTIAENLPAARIIALTTDCENGKGGSGGLPHNVTVLSPLDDLEAIGPLLKKQLNSLR